MVTINSEIFEGSTYRWKLTALKDSATWDLTGGTVTVYFMKRGESSQAFSCSIDEDEAYYDNETDLLTEGDWYIRYKVELDSIVISHYWIHFYVHGSLE